eukprot:366483-Chlamydomonas_euryale.AAC.2
MHGHANAQQHARQRAHVGRYRQAEAVQHNPVSANTRQDTLAHHPAGQCHTSWHGVRGAWDGHDPVTDHKQPHWEAHGSLSTSGVHSWSWYVVSPCVRCKSTLSITTDSPLGPTCCMPISTQANHRHPSGTSSCAAATWASTTRKLPASPAPWHCRARRPPTGARAHASPTGQCLVGPSSDTAANRGGMSRLPMYAKPSSKLRTHKASSPKYLVLVRPSSKSQPAVSTTTPGTLSGDANKVRPRWSPCSHASSARTHAPRRRPTAHTPRAQQPGRAAAAARRGPGRSASKPLAPTSISGLCKAASAATRSVYIAWWLLASAGGTRRT